MGAFDLKNHELTVEEMHRKRHRICQHPGIAHNACKAAFPSDVNLKSLVSFEISTTCMSSFHKPQKISDSLMAADFFCRFTKTPIAAEAAHLIDQTVELAGECVKLLRLTAVGTPTASPRSRRQFSE